MNQLTIDQALKLAAGYLNNKQPQHALQVYNQILSSNPNHAESLFGKGTAYLFMGNSNEAFPILKEISNRFPENPFCHANLALAAYQENNFELAQSEAQKAIALKPNIPEALNVLADLAYKNNDYKTASDYYRRISKARDLSIRHQVREKDGYLDKQEFRYILWLDRIYQKIQNVPGHIVELGVARGRNAIIFSTLIQLNGDDAVRKYFGFDTFEGYTDEDVQLDPHLVPDDWKCNTLEWVNQRIKNCNFEKLCTLYQGDIKETVPAFVDSKPNFRAALVYVDCNAYLPAMKGMEALLNYMTPGGIICIDEKIQGGETRALIEFCQKYGYKFQKDASPFSIPAYTQIE